MISYRSLKRVLGETSLERKCRFLFGGGLMLLIAGSFYIYLVRTRSIIRTQNEQLAKTLVRKALTHEHYNILSQAASGSVAADLAESRLWSDLERFSESVRQYQPPALAGTGIGDEYRWSLQGPEAAVLHPSDDHDAWDAILRRGKNSVVKIDKDEQEFVYHAAIHIEQSCVNCHDEAVGSVIGKLRIAIPTKHTDREVARNAAILLATAIVTAFLAMLAAYVIVRYVIVKPVLHLKEVSDEIARGNLDLRAEINTGDEFEELSHAFNRMLRHMITAQEELRGLNTDLDAKVDELAQVTLRMYETSKLKDDFLATMTHELRTPLNSILGFSDLLAEATNLDEKQLRYIDNVRTSGRGLMTLINDLLDLAKIESGKMDIQPTEFSIDELIERQAATVMPLAQKKNIDVSSQVATSLPASLQDVGKLQQILNNLLSNAIKFTPEGGRVRLTAERAAGDMLELVVEDSGIGIPLPEQETIFEKFRQGSSIPGERDAMTREYEGTGLGLSIVRELSKLLGGEVELESEFGKGSTFTVRVPFRIGDTHHTAADVLEQRVREQMLSLEGPKVSSRQTGRITHVDANASGHDEDAA